MVKTITIRKSTLVLHSTITVAILLAVVVPAPARSESDTTTGRINAQIVAPVGVGGVSDMSFSRLSRPASPGAAQTTSANHMASTSLVLIQADASSPAKIVISGSPHQAVGLLVGDIGPNGPNNQAIAVSDYSHTGGAMPALGLDGRTTIELGATLHFSANLQDGRYRGMFDVIVSNN